MEAISCQRVSWRPVELYLILSDAPGKRWDAEQVLTAVLLEAPGYAVFRNKVSNDFLIHMKLWRKTPLAHNGTFWPGISALRSSHLGYQTNRGW